MSFTFFISRPRVNVAGDPQVDQGDRVVGRNIRTAKTVVAKFGRRYDRLRGREFCDELGERHRTYTRGEQERFLRRSMVKNERDPSKRCEGFRNLPANDAGASARMRGRGCSNVSNKRREAMAAIETEDGTAGRTFSAAPAAAAMRSRRTRRGCRVDDETPGEANLLAHFGLAHGEGFSAGGYAEEMPYDRLALAEIPRPGSPGRTSRHRLTSPGERTRRASSTR